MNFTDYYRILEVHYDARPEVIQAAYKRLSRLYHPDSGYVLDSSRMNLINEAYSVLNDTKKRSAYHTEWLKHFTCRSRLVTSSLLTPPGQGDSSPDAAKYTMETFFQAQKQGKSDEAYLLLTKEDQERTSPEDFASWRSLVSQCYEIQDFKVRYFSSYKNCRIDNMIYPLVAEFAVTVTDMDTLTLNVSSETLRKYAAFDGVSWKICLGMHSIKKSILQFQLLTEKRSNFDPMMLYRSAVSLKDPLTGLLSEAGFLEQAQREAQRSRRYHNPFCIAVFRLYHNNARKEEQGSYKDLCSFASLVSANIRSTDLTARLNNGMIACLFIETGEQNAKKAAEKFLHLFEKKRNAMKSSCQIESAVMPFHEYENIEDIIYKACSKASITDHTIHFAEEA